MTSQIPVAERVPPMNLQGTREHNSTPGLSLPPASESAVPFGLWFFGVEPRHLPAALSKKVGALIRSLFRLGYSGRGSSC